VGGWPPPRGGPGGGGGGGVTHLLSREGVGNPISTKDSHSGTLCIL
jgi:hypothetical protein